jgi:hypothetical protein
MQMMAQVIEQMTNIQAEQANEREANRLQIRALQENLASLHTTPTTTPGASTPLPQPELKVTPPSPPAQAKKKKPTLPDPARFDGNRKEFPAWILEMENKLETDGETIGGQKDQFSYIFSRLEKGAKSMTTSYAKCGGPGGTFNPDAFLKYLDACYGDPNLKQRALGRLADLRQGDKESFATFLPKFERELADSGGATWPADVQISYLRRSLNTGMKKLLLGQRGMPTDYLGYVRALQELGTNLDQERYSSQKDRHTPQANSPAPAQGPPKAEQASTPPQDTMDWEPTKISKAVQRQNKELAGKRAKWVDEKEQELRRKEDRCFRCGRPQCRIKKCPLRPARRPTPSARAQVKKSHPMLPAVEDLVDSDSDTSGQAESEGEELKE